MIDSLDLVNAGEDTYELFSKGHHDPVEFMREVKKRFKWMGTMSTPEHVWMKAIPKDGYHAWYVPTSVGTRGAFPATVCSESYDDKDVAFYKSVSDAPHTNENCEGDDA